MHLLKYFTLFILLCGLVTTLVGCSTGSGQQKIPLNLEGQWRQAALAEDTIHVFTHSSDVLLAGTSQGVFSRKLSAPPNNSWHTRGLEKKQIIDVVILGNQKILAGAKLSQIESSQNSLFLTTNGGEEWMPYQQNFGGEHQYSWLTALSRIPRIPPFCMLKQVRWLWLSLPIWGKAGSSSSAAGNPNLDFQFF